MYRMYMHSHKAIYTELTDRIREAVRGLKVLDAACGNGLATLKYASSASSCTACDYAEKMIEYAETLDHPSNVSFELQDICDLPYEDRSFDAVVMLNALDQVAEPEKALQEAARVLKDDGILIVPTYAGGRADRGTFYRQAALFGSPLIYSSWTPQAFLDFLEANDWVAAEYCVISASAPFMYAECRKNSIPKRAETISASTADEEFWLPLKARIFTSKAYPHILFDRPSLNIEEKLPEIARNMPDVSEFSMLSYSVLSAEAEKVIRRYTQICPDLMVVNIKAGMETFSLRCREDNQIFYELDDPSSLELRQTYFPSSWYDRYLPYHPLDERWISGIRKEAGRPLLINACGAFFDFTKEEVVSFLRICSSYGGAFVLFDADSSGSGGILVKRTNLNERRMPSFTIDDIQGFVKELDFPCEVLESSTLFRGIEKKGMKSDTKFRIELIEKMKLRNIYILKTGTFR